MAADRGAPEHGVAAARHGLDDAVVRIRDQVAVVAGAALRALLAQGRLAWIATQVMRDELERVLAYPQIVSRLTFYKLSADDVLAQFDRHARIVDIAPKADITCKDADDQKFIDLAVQHRALLLSKDAAVLTMAKRMLARSAAVSRAWTPLTSAA